MKTYPHLFSKLFCQPVLLHEPVRYALESALLQRMGLSHRGAKPRAHDDNPDLDGTDDPAPQSQAPDWRLARIYQRYGSVAVIELTGVIDKHISDFEMECYGGYDVSDFDRALIQAGADPQIEKVVLSINSPGGSVTGIPESAARVAALTAQKEVHAFVDAMACSAAYYIASQADHIAAAPSAILGSIGVYMTLIDATRAAEMEGYKVELITAGKFKAMGSPFKPLTDEERAMLQASVTDLHQDFRSAVRNGRRAPTERGGHQTVADSVMEGQWFDGKAALQNRLVDELTGANLDEYVAGLIG
jgi:signal peptide peptidase SppA